MTATFDEANDAILDLFKTAWDTTGHPVTYENVKPTKPFPPTTNIPWARVMVRHTGGRQGSLTGGLSITRWNRNGLFTAQIFTPNGDGLSLGYSLCKIVTDAFEGVATVSTRVWCRNVRINEIGPDGEWFQFNVIAEFTYDEVK